MTVENDPSIATDATPAHRPGLRRATETQQTRAASQIGDRPLALVVDVMTTSSANQNGSMICADVRLAANNAVPAQRLSVNNLARERLIHDAQRSGDMMVLLNKMRGTSTIALMIGEAAPSTATRSKPTRHLTARGDPTDRLLPVRGKSVARVKISVREAGGMITRSKTRGISKVAATSDAHAMIIVPRVLLRTWSTASFAPKGQRQINAPHRRRVPRSPHHCVLRGR